MRLLQSSSSAVKSEVHSELSEALAVCRGAFIASAVFSGMSNILMLTGAIFMLEIYDRVLPSHSVPTLVALIVIATALYAALGVLDLIRGRILVRVGASLDEAISDRVYDALVGLPLKAGNRGDGLQSLRHLDNLRTFLSGMGPIAFFDLPWIPLYLAICFAFHTLIGVTALIGAIILCALTILTEVYTRDSSKHAIGLGSVAKQPCRNEPAQCRGSRRDGNDAAPGEALARDKSKIHRQPAEDERRCRRVCLDLKGLADGVAIGGARRWRLPCHQSTGNRRHHHRRFDPERAGACARRSRDRQLEGIYRRTPELAGVEPTPPLFPVQSERMALQAPATTLSVNSASVAPPGVQRLVANNINFALNAGSGLGIIGPSGSGKSSLARLLVGVWQPARGKVCLDGASLDQWSPDVLGQHIGYLPQDVELLDGNIAENIGRFAPNPSAEAVIAAAKAAGVHELIVSMPEGYATPIGEQGTALSAGQAQRIALARALYGDPFLVVLDEPIETSMPMATTPSHTRFSASRRERALSSWLRTVRARSLALIWSWR